MIARELDMASNYLGKLGDDIRIRLQRVVENPTQDTWDDTYCILLSGEGKGVTLWQAVLAVCPSFPDSKPSDAPWPCVPSREVIIQAIRYATH